MIKKYITSDEASEIITQLGLEFAVISNPENVYPPFEVYPLAPKITHTQKELSAVLLNTDGVLASVGNLHLHALEYMVRQISGRFEKEQWFGLDKLIDYPNILAPGSNVNPVDFLIQRYHNFIKPDFFKEAYFHSALWTLILGKDENRKKDVRRNLTLLGCSGMLEDPKLNEYIAQKEFGKYSANVITNYFLHKYCLNLNIQNFSVTAAAASDIYYKRCQEILEIIKLGEGINFAGQVLSGDDKLFIKPSPGIPHFIALVKGWLGDEAHLIFDQLIDLLKTNSSQSYRISDVIAAKNKFIRLSIEFEKNPLTIGLISSESRYNASIIINEVLQIASSQIRGWKISEERKNVILEKFSDFNNVFSTIVTSGDINKMRHKPFRDPYSIALNQLDLHSSRFNEVIGIENSENGIVSLRSSGIGLSVVIPPDRSSTLNLASASFIIPGGIPELLLNYDCFKSV
ncbi:MAG: hypothetical protein ACM34K_20390 [Bacillota bacterium]